MKASTNRILTTHTGSLHRPADLEELFRRKLAGEPYDESAFQARLRSGVAEIVRKQAEIGIDIVDDGEFSKVDFFSYAKYRLDGLERRAVQTAAGVSANKFLHPTMKSVMSSVALRRRFAEFYADTEPATGVTTPPSVVQMYVPVGSAVEPPAVYAVVGPLKYKRHEIDRDIANFKAALPGVKVEEAFMPVVAPAMWADRHANEHYASEEEYYGAVADVLNEEYRAIVDAGFLLQIDDVSMPGRHRVQVEREGAAAFNKWLGLCVEAQNQALRGIPPEKVRYHMCWASQNAPHTDDVPLVEIIDAILGIKAQGYQLEAANVRHEHEWKVWRDVKLAPDKILMPGVICHATNVIEHPEYVAERILRYTGIVGRERVIAATDCGFRWRVHPQIAWAKMEALVEGAKVASKELWRR
jgi:5-methyltetrahydropteroyltriglutamate--homocysteine methyltransferase